jgi:hypothetical protein
VQETLHSCNRSKLNLRRRSTICQCADDRSCEFGRDHSTREAVEQKGGLQGRSVIAGRARQRAANVAPTIKELKAAGVTTLQGIAAALNARGIHTATGRGEWQPVQVRRRVLARLSA